MSIIHPGETSYFPIIIHMIKSDTYMVILSAQDFPVVQPIAISQSKVSIHLPNDPDIRNNVVTQEEPMFLYEVSPDENHGCSYIVARSHTENDPTVICQDARLDSGCSIYRYTPMYGVDGTHRHITLSPL